MADEIITAIMKVCRDWYPDVVDQINGDKRVYKMHHNRVEDPINSKGKVKTKNNLVQVSFSLSKYEYFSSRGIGQKPQSRQQKPVFAIGEHLPELQARLNAEIGATIINRLVW
jgi:hypothetical protein